MSEDMESLLRGHRRYFAEGRTRDVRFRAEALRRFLAEHGFEILEERPVLSLGRPYSVLLTAYLLVIQHYCDWTQMAYPWAVKLGLVLGVVAGAAVLYIGTLAVCGYRLSDLKASEVD